MNDWVTLTGQLTRPQIATKFAAADLYIAPATLESFGIAALEARAAGLPVLGRCCTGLSDFVVDGVNGRLVDGDRQMADAIVTMATGGLPPGAAGTDGVQLFSWPAVVERTRDVYLHAGAKAAVPAPVDGRR
jgi:glycosyltransferase involved in cell wall biosynthesis